MNTNHPYKNHEGTPLWIAVEAAITALVKNGDLAEKAARAHIVGYLCETISEAQRKNAR